MIAWLQDIFCSLDSLAYRPCGRPVGAFFGYVVSWFSVLIILLLCGLPICITPSFYVASSLRTVHPVLHVTLLFPTGAKVT